MLTLKHLTVFSPLQEGEPAPAYALVYASQVPQAWLSTLEGPDIAIEYLPGVEPFSNASLADIYNDYLEAVAEACLQWDRRRYLDTVSTRNTWRRKLAEAYRPGVPEHIRHAVCQDYDRYRAKINVRPPGRPPVPGNTLCEQEKLLHLWLTQSRPLWVTPPPEDREHILYRQAGGTEVGMNPLKATRRIFDAYLRLDTTSPGYVASPSLQDMMQHWWLHNPLPVIPGSGDIQRYRAQEVGVRGAWASEALNALIQVWPYHRLVETVLRAPQSITEGSHSELVSHITAQNVYTRLIAMNTHDAPALYPQVLEAAQTLLGEQHDH